ncbi:MAG: aminotransferase class V-fold PLP-dependent enzyme [Aureispira sp.]|nr:aminotransferase class V-fold PLP-dependent enzyme [Aureispira sp.]
MLDKIKALEQLALQLEPDGIARQHIREKVVNYSEGFLENIETILTYQVTTDKGSAIYDTAISEEPKSIEQLLKVVAHNVDRPGLNPASGGHLAYIPGGGLFPSALGDYLAAVFNRYAGVFYGSPGAVRMENQLLRWLCDVVGFPESAGGNLTSGGSIANQIAIGAARDAKGLKARDFDRMVIYTTQQVHHCVHKAINMVGLREAVKRNIPINEHFQMDTVALEKQIQQDRNNGLLPFMVIASAGTTDVGAVDPLEAVAAICQRFELWFHVDAAYGGFFVLCPETSALFRGIEQADSVVVDPHKGLFLPYGTGAVLVRDTQKLYDSQHMEASYLQDAFQDIEELSPADLSPELTKHFRGMRFWLPLQLFGVAPFRAGLSEKIWLCRYFYEEIQKIEGFEVGAYPQLSVMMFRYVPKEGDANLFNDELVKGVKEDGRVFLSSTTIEGVYYIRLAVLSFRTHLHTIETCLEVLKEQVGLIKSKTKN